MSYTITLRDVEQAVYRRMRETDSRLLNSTDVVLWINEGYTILLNERYYRFTEETLNFNTSIDTTLAEDITSANTDFDVGSATGMLSVGKILINGDFITYTSKVGNNLQGVSGIGANHDSGATVRRVYQMSELGVTNFDKVLSLQVNDIEYGFYDGRNGFNGAGFSLTKDNDIILTSQSQESRVALRYKKSITRLSANADLFIIPDDYIGIITEYAIYKAKLDLGYDDTDKHYREYIRLKKLMKADLTNPTEGKMKQIKSIYQDDFYRNPNMSNY